jgi:hypothetical protein
MLKPIHPKGEKKEKRMKHIWGRKKKDEQIQIFSWCLFSLTKCKATLTLPCLVMLSCCKLRIAQIISLGVKEKCS